jgi:hypothetical protein
MLEELEDFYKEAQNTYKSILPTEKLTTEEYLFVFNTNFFHLLSIEWSKAKVKHTTSYAQYLLELMLDNLNYAIIANNADFKQFQADVLATYTTMQKEITKESYDQFILIMSLDSIREQTYMLAFAIRLIELCENQPLSKILEHYKTLHSPAKVA